MGLTHCKLGKQCNYSFSIGVNGPTLNNLEEKYMSEMMDGKEGNKKTKRVGQTIAVETCYPMI